MKRMKLIVPRGLAWGLVAWLGCSAALAFVYETEKEFYATGDFDGDGRQDVVVVDRATGKYRLGYAQADGTFKWLANRVTGIKDLTGVTLGHFFDPKQDALGVTAADANKVAIVDVSNPGQPNPPVPVPYESLGPATLLAVDVGGEGNTPLDDLFIESIYNDPDPFKGSLLRNESGKIEKIISEQTMQRQATRANRIALKTGGPLFAAGILNGDNDAVFAVADFSSAEPQTVAEVQGLAKNTAFAVAHFRGQPEAELMFYVPGEPKLQVALVESASDTSATLGSLKDFDLGKPIKLALPVAGEKGDQLLVLFGRGDSAEVYKFDAASAPAPVQSIAPRQGELLFGAAAVDQQFVVFQAADYSKFATHQQVYHWVGPTNAAAAFGKIGSMADNDDATVPDIWKHILAALEQESIKSEADMKPYTNTIPGTQVTYVMVPIPGGEFEMGSPESEPGRQPDEGPQHKVKISPFWMAKFELTWNEYELFMYPDDEKKLRAEYPTADYINKVSDAVTRPSKPYTEMSFGMGRDGYPAICMTQHSANKYCQWLSAKTGHFYRLPTEAEWEYACRAGTTTAYSFGDDVSKLPEYGWFEDNGDFKYQKVGKKKPNPWGLYDMHGNVWEWCLDQYVDDYAKVVEKTGNVDPWYKATMPYPHVVRGGSYDDPADRLRSAARRGSDRSWKMRDPQLPKSIWWHSDAPWVGIRIVRPLKVPSPEMLQKYWTSGVEKD